MVMDHMDSKHFLQVFMMAVLVILATTRTFGQPQRTIVITRTTVDVVQAQTCILATKTGTDNTLSVSSRIILNHILKDFICQLY